MLRIIAGIIITAGIALPALASAAFPTKPPESFVSSEGIEGVGKIFTTLGGWFWGILLALAVIFILVAAFNFLTSGGEEEKIKKARSYITYAVVAVAVAILATGIVRLTRYLLGESTPAAQPTCRVDTDCPAGQKCNVAGSCYTPRFP